ncbi:ARM repeat superfamily protein isoform X2 [Tasmannia lanceolata]|uniref:ARM repeat superfamily protein isoform X2 n=1 Tax=Tasmannia lanceolata TaxID=3420 RepID=UPI004063AD9C
MALSGIRAWRTAFLTLRDETLTFPPRTLLPDLLRNLIFSHSEILVSAASALPPHEIASDLILLVELAGAISEGEDVEYTFINTCHLIHDVSCRIRLEMNSSSWVVMFGFFEKMVQWSLCTDTKTACSGNAARMKAIREILEILRNCSLAENSKILELLLHIISRSHAVLFCSSYSSGNQRYAIDIGTKIPKCNDLWEVQTIAFSMIGDAFSRNGSNISVNMWQSMLEVLRKVIDGLVSRSLLVEDYVMSRFYNSLLHCLHLVLSDPKGSLSEHVAGFVASLQMFFTYGITNKSLVVFKEKEFSSINLNSRLEQSRKIERGGTYRPPHLRKREEMSVQPFKARGFRCSSDCEPFGLGFMSSDSEHSDSDGPVKDTDRFRCSKARIAAIICIQDLCEADPKSLTAYWPMLLPTNDVLQLRKYQATLMTCLLFDPILKTRMASASALAAMLDGPSSVFLQVAEYKESTKCGSFTTLSSSLGQILMQLHAGLLYLIQHETHSGLLASVFKLLMLLISATPYIRMPIELLPTVISTVHKRILEDFSLKTNQTSLLATALSCLASALSTSPPSSQVAELLQEGTSTDVVGVQPNSSVLGSMFQFSQRVMHPTIAFEALQALRAVSHNYPNVMAAYWEQVSATVYGLLREGGPDCPIYEVQSRPWKVDVGNALGSTPEKCTMAAIRVLDECLRATSGFKGTDNLLEDKLLDTPFTSDCTRTKKISSAPWYELNGSEVSEGNLTGYSSGVKQWCEAIEKHLPSTLLHKAPMVRAASVTCFAGTTSSVFFLLPKEKQDFIISSVISLAISDEVPSVRAAACRAIGVISCFPQIFESTEILVEFIRAAEINTHDTLVSVRITASWALANICDSLRHRASDLHLDKCSSGPNAYSGSISLLAECALRLTKDGDKIKSNAVRALGNLSRFVRFTNQSAMCGPVDGDPHWLERMVQAFLSCVTTGNVKVQWNVCHALGNLFLNETLKLQDMIWAPSVYSILLLLLRDSTNFKIRIHAASALAVPTSRHEYGSSFSDVVQGLEHILENLSSDQSLTPSSFKYMGTLEKQLTSTTLHVLGLVSCNDPPPLQDFLAKKASFLEEWLKSLWSSLAEQTSDQLAPETTSIEKKAMVSKAIRSLLQIYEGSNKLQSIARRFEKLADCLS